MKITYYVQRYRPSFEAISKEVRALAEHFSNSNIVRIHDLHLDGITKIRIDKKVVSYHFMYYLLTAPFVKYKSAKNSINHIYTSLGDLPYLPIFSPTNTILTAAASCNFRKVKKRAYFLKRLPKIIVESEKQRKILLELGVAEKKIEVIHPPVDLSAYSYQRPRPANRQFSILYASCPTRKEDFSKRGIYLLLECAKRNKEIIIDLAWRVGALKEITSSVKKADLTNVTLTNNLIADMNQRYANAHCTIIPYTKPDDYLKLIPNSALESLAAGKPLLVSSAAGLAEFVKDHRCGVVFDPNIKSLEKAISKLKNDYKSFQKNCRPACEKYFSKERFF